MIYILEIIKRNTYKFHNIKYNPEVKFFFNIPYKKSLYSHIKKKQYYIQYYNLQLLTQVFLFFPII